MTFNPTEVLQVIIMASVASVVLSSTICLTLPKHRKA